MPLPPIAVLTHEFFPYRGGIAVYVEETARAAAAGGRKVTVWAPSKPALRTRQWPFKVHSMPMRGSQDWRDRMVMAREIKKARTELGESIVWLPEPGALLTAMYLNALGRMPARHIVVTLHGSEILRFSQWPHRRKFFQKLLDRAARIGVVSEFNKHLLFDHFRTDAEKIRVVPGGLRTDFPKTMPAVPPKVEGGNLIILTVARIHPRKGQLCVIEALAQLPMELRKRVEYQVAGPVVKKAYQKELEERAAVSGVKVRFLGEVADAALPMLYASADVFALTPMPHGPSLEGFGLALVEAGASGLAAIAHRTGGVPEAVRHNVTGLLVDPWDRPGLAEGLARLLGDAQLRATMGGAAKIRARELSWANNAGALFGGLD